MREVYYSRSDITGDISMSNMHIKDTLDKIESDLSARGKDSELIEWIETLDEILNMLKSKAEIYEKLFAIRPLHEGD